ncbi:MAG: SusC/RagA family TonB-linked outer membrane protein [Schleiferiaceae bacterium]|nr:SusC/RagA family TonB-linked outer membrane protein [Schleiferiaceae bacterium]
MKNNFSLLGVLLFVLFTNLALAQSKTVSGLVKATESGEPLPGVAVLEKGTQNGTVTDFDGKFTLTVSGSNAILQLSSMGMESKEVTVGSNDYIVVNLDLSSDQLDEVTVTALGLEAKRDEVGVASTRVDGAQLAATGETRLIQNLNGKSAGVNVTQSSGDPGAGSKIQIRGATSITGDVQPLIIIDGVPMFNDSYYGEAFGGQNSTSGSVGSGGGVTQQSRLNDLNPADIESVEVLRGASAAAIWGSRAANGVLVITTKKGSAQGTKDFTVNVNLSASFQNVNRKIALNEKYGQGYNMTYKDGSPTGFARSLSWGDKLSERPGGNDVFYQPGDAEYMGFFTSNTTGNKYYRVVDGTQADPNGGKNNNTVYDPYEQLFKTGVTWDNSVSIQSAGPKGSVYFSLADTRQDGIIKRNSNFNKTSVRLNVFKPLGKQWKITSGLNFTASNSARVQMGSNLSGLFLGGLRNPADFDMRDYIGTYTDANGAAFRDQPRAFRNAIGANPGYGYDNPLWMMDNITSDSKVQRLFGKVEFGYDPTSWLSFIWRNGFDTYTDSRDDFFDALSAGSNNGGRYVKEKFVRNQFNTDFIARGTWMLSDDFDLTALLGANYNVRTYDDIATDGRSFINPLSPPQLNNTTNQTLFKVYEEQRTVGYYADVNLGMFDQVFVNLSGRMDYLSTLPQDNNSIFYPAANVAWQFSKLLGSDGNDAFSFGKFRLGWGQVGRGPSPYSTSTVYISPTANIGGYGEGWGPGVNPAAYGGGQSLSNVAGNPNIKPEIKTETEVGFDLRFLKDRLYANLTYYTNKTEDLIIQVDVAQSTGFAQQVVNGAEITNNGFEIELGGDVIKKENFVWNLYGIYTQNRNEVTKMNGVNSIYLSGFSGTSSRAVLGEQLGVLWGAKWQREENGSLALDANGFPTLAAAAGVIGDPNPKFRWSVGSGMTIYKAWNVNFLVDAAVGGKMWNGTKGALAFFGRAGYTDVEQTVSGDLITYYGDKVSDVYPHRANGDGTYTVRGQVRDFGGGNVFLDELWYTDGPGSGFTGPDEQFVEEITWTRLRELSVGYNFQRKQLDKMKLQAFSINLIVNNLFLITNYDGNDPDQSLSGAGQNGLGLDYFQNPSVRTIRIALNLTI